MKGIVLENIEKDELLDAIRNTVTDSAMVLVIMSEAADIIGCSRQYVSILARNGKLRDYSRNNEHRKYSAREVLTIRREKLKENELIKN